jgi:hypothetical protein
MKETKEDVFQKLLDEYCKDEARIDTLVYEPDQHIPDLDREYFMKRYEEAKQGDSKCPYCHSDGHTRWDNRSVWGSKEILDCYGESNNLFINLSSKTLLEGYAMSEFEIYYCPMCGRKL